MVGQDIQPREKCAIGSTGGCGRRQAERRERRLGEDKPVQVRPARLRGKKQRIPDDEKLKISNPPAEKGKRRHGQIRSD